MISKSKSSKSASVSKAAPSQKGSFLPIVYEDETIFILNKAAGIPSIPLAAHETETAVGSALAHCPEIAGVGKGGLEPGILHRLDTLTSGLLVFAKINSEFERLKNLWKQGRVRKFYRAIVQKKSSVTANSTALNGEPGSSNSNKSINALLCSLPLTITTPLGRSAKSAKRMIALTPEKKFKIRGKLLTAHTIILETSSRSPTDLVKEIPTLDLLIEIKTGVMHQIRCHLASIGWPIVGDPIYGEKRTGKSSDSILSYTRLFLHAWKLEIPLQNNGTVLKVQANLPGDFFSQLVLPVPLGPKIK